jgi:proteasome lid subunit RPN8/RPN11
MQQDIKIFDKDILEQIKDLSKENLKEEICGFIYLKNNKQKIFKCQNISSQKDKKFIINPEDFERCSYYGQIISVFHSHINNRGFSEEDIIESLKNQIPYALYNIRQDKFYFFDSIKYKHYEKYINIPYRNGYDDCWSIIQKYFKNELNINFSDPEPDRYDYEDEFEWNRLKKARCNYDPFSWEYDVRQSFFNSNGLFKIPFNSFEDIKVNDILIIKYPWQPFSTFGAIYLGDGLILEHVNQEPSKICSIRKGHKKSIQYILRYINE